HRRDDHLAPVGIGLRRPWLVRQIDAGVGVKFTGGLRHAQQGVDRYGLLIALESKRIELQRLIIDDDLAAHQSRLKRAFAAQRRRQAVEPGIGKQLFAWIEARNLQREPPWPLIGLRKRDVELRCERIGEHHAQSRMLVPCFSAESTGVGALADGPAETPRAFSHIYVALCDPPGELHLSLRRAHLETLDRQAFLGDRKSTRLNSSHVKISYAVFCLKKKKHK